MQDAPETPTDAPQDVAPDIADSPAQLDVAEGSPQFDMQVAAPVLAVISFAIAVIMLALGFAGSAGILLAVAVVSFFARSQVNELVVSALALVPVVVIANVMHTNADDAGSVALMLVWVSLFCWYFLPRKNAIALNVLIIIGYDWAVALEEITSEEILLKFITFAGTVLSAAFVIWVGKTRVNQLIASLAELASTDPLTTLPNRRVFQKRVAAAVLKVDRYGGDLTLLMLDVDHFKRVNDTWGHAEGDRILHSVAEQIVDAKRGTDIVARIGGEEFALLLPETSMEGAVTVAERIRASVSQMRLPDSTTASISIGCATYPKDGDSVERLVDAADRALYVAKETGRNRTIVFERVLGEAVKISREISDAERRISLDVLLRASSTEHEGDVRTRLDVLSGIAGRIAAEMGLTPQQCEHVRVAALYHDIGKIGVSRYLLSKDSPLTEDEWKQVRNYPKIGGEILRNMGYPEIAAWIGQIHQRVDSPGDAAPTDNERIAARIVGVVDAFDAMTRPNTFRAPFSVEHAARELKLHAGTQFDKQVVTLFTQQLTQLATEQISLLVQHEFSA